MKLILGGRLNSWDRKGQLLWCMSLRLRHPQQSSGPMPGCSTTSRTRPYALWDLVPTLFSSHSLDTESPNGQFLDPLSGSTYEAGLKSSFFGGRANTALSVFSRIEQDDFGVLDGDIPVPGTENK
ncbi:MAG: hypothetical protein U5M50_06780 [Sphingobium sp.]|nr:hypothetical protein [Sphingobium sp.]